VRNILIAGATAAFSALAPQLADAWQAENRLTVNPVSDSVFEVIGLPGSPGSEFWCAAGDYALRVLRTSGTQRVYIVRGRAAPVTGTGPSAVQFSLVLPDGVPPQSGLFLSMKKVGDNLSVDFARTYCLDKKSVDF